MFIETIFIKTTNNSHNRDRFTESIGQSYHGHFTVIQNHVFAEYSVIGENVYTIKFKVKKFKMSNCI